MKNRFLNWVWLFALIPFFVFGWLFVSTCNRQIELGTFDPAVNPNVSLALYFELICLIVSGYATFIGIRHMGRREVWGDPIPLEKLPENHAFSYVRSVIYHGSGKDVVMLHILRDQDSKLLVAVHSLGSLPQTFLIRNGEVLNFADQTSGGRVREAPPAREAFAG